MSVFLVLLHNQEMWWKENLFAIFTQYFHTKHFPCAKVLDCTIMPQAPTLLSAKGSCLNPHPKIVKNKKSWRSLKKFWKFLRIREELLRII